MFQPEYVPNEAKFNKALLLHNIEQDFLQMVVRDVLGSHSLQGLAVKTTMKAQKDFNLSQAEWEQLTDDVVDFLRKRAGDLVLKLSYSFEDLVSHDSVSA